ncbi:MAG: hypothetical protein C0490_10390, partial [Marivirga sp.]|nr:hypothetical protein [Marivirga sp.]
MRNLYLVACITLLTSVGYAQMTDDFETTDEDFAVSLVVTDNDAVFFPQPETVDLNTTASGRQTTANTPEGFYVVNNSGRV